VKKEVAAAAAKAQASSPTDYFQAAASHTAVVRELVTYRHNHEQKVGVRWCRSGVWALVIFMYINKLSAENLLNS